MQGKPVVWQGLAVRQERGALAETLRGPAAAVRFSLLYVLRRARLDARSVFQ
jgi:hypothetical protein